jgi:hypothetical protein
MYCDLLGYDMLQSGMGYQGKKKLGSKNEGNTVCYTATLVSTNHTTYAITQKNAI